MKVDNLYKYEKGKYIKIAESIQLYIAKYNMVDGKPVGKLEYTPVYTKGGYDANAATRG